MSDISREAVERLAKVCGDVLFKEYEGHLPVGNIAPHTLEELDCTLLALQARCERLEGALHVFADAADDCDECGFDDFNQAPVSAGECRAARAALNDTDGEAV